MSSWIQSSKCVYDTLPPAMFVSGACPSIHTILSTMEETSGLLPNYRPQHAYLHLKMYAPPTCKRNCSPVFHIWVLSLSPACTYVCPNPAYMTCVLPCKQEVNHNYSIHCLIWRKLHRLMVITLEVWGPSSLLVAIFRVQATKVHMTLSLLLGM